MRTHILQALVVVALSSVAQDARAQQTTEQFIPVGQSPGVSNVLSYIGEIESSDRAARTVTVAGPEGSMTFMITDSTEVWLDRSAMRESSVVGSLTDLTVGRRIEVKYENPETRDVAEWIKVAITAGE